MFCIYLLHINVTNMQKYFFLWCDDDKMYVKVFKKNKISKMIFSFHCCSSGFLTGYRRAPILGIDQVKMKVFAIQSSTCEQHFPESETCHSNLYLPFYSTKEIMRDRLTEALLADTDFTLWCWIVCSSKGACTVSEPRRRDEIYLYSWNSSSFPVVPQDNLHCALQ